MESKSYHHNPACKVLLFSFLVLLLVPAAICLPQDFEVQDYPAAYKTQRIIDIELDNLYYRAVWQDSQNNMWICDVDPINGVLDPPNGKGTLLASGLASIENGNGPEWVYSGNQGISIVYVLSDEVYTYKLQAVKEDSPDIWTTYDLNLSRGRFCPVGTFSGNTGKAKIAYFKLNAGAEPSLCWRNLYEYDSEEVIVDERAQAHFSLDGTKIALAQVCQGGNETRDPMILDLSIPEKRLVKHTFTPAAFPWVLYPDELNNKETMMYCLFNSSGPVLINVAQENDDGVWQSIKVITAQDPSEPYISSPEPFIANGKQYVVYAALSIPEPFFLYSPSATSSIWIASLNPDDPLHRKITPDFPSTKRFEPEALTLPASGKTVIYYTYSPKGETPGQLRIALTGF